MNVLGCESEHRERCGVRGVSEGHAAPRPLGDAEADIRRSLKKNGFGDITLPDVSGKGFDPAKVVSLDAQYVW